MPGGDGDGLDLLVGVQAGLAGLQLDEVEHLGLALQDQVVKRSRTAARCRTGTRAHTAWAARARSKAPVTSSGVDSGRSASFSPVNGV